VRDYRKWPGFNTRPSDWQRGTRTARRPNVYFKNTPEEIAYSVCAPTQLGHCVEHAIATVELHMRIPDEPEQRFRTDPIADSDWTRSLIPTDPNSDSGGPDR
jgi:hypothetical protein